MIAHHSGFFMRYAVVSDIHEDILSLKQAFRQIDKLKVDKVACLGDISGFSVPFYSHLETRDAHACLELLSQNCEIIIPGNHDLHIAGRIPQYSPEFKYPADWYEMNYHQRKEISLELLWLYEENELNPLYTEEDLIYLKELNEVHTFSFDTRSIMLSHYAYPTLLGMSRAFYLNHMDFRQHFSFMKEQKVNLSIIGHMHPKGLFYVDKTEVFDFGFKKRPLPDGPVTIVAPSITNGGKSNGFLILDFLQKEMEAHKISTKK